MTVILRPRRSGVAEVRALLARHETGRRRPAAISVDELTRLRGAAPADIARVTRHATDHDLTVAAVDVAARSVVLTGPAGRMAAAFGATLRRIRIGRHVFRDRTGPLYVPRALARVVLAIVGFETRPAVRRERRPARRPRRRAPQWSSGSATASYTPPRIAAMYGLRRRAAANECVGILALNEADSNGAAVAGGFSVANVNTYFGSIGVSPPAISLVSVAGGSNLPGYNSGLDDEMTMDVEIAGAVAQKAGLAVYFAPNTDPGFLEAIAAVVADVARDPSVLSISYGGAERWWLPSVIEATNDLFIDATLRRITVCCASGDYGSSADPPGYWNGKPHALFPASSPYALACGGTKIIVSSGRITDEVTWNSWGQASGGGVSDHFDLPAYQAGAGVPTRGDGSPGRGVPDVAGVADYDSGYKLRWPDGTTALAGGGTSATTPLFAAIIAVGNSALRARSKPRLGFVQPLLYGTAGRRVLFDVVTGTNDLEGFGGLYKARVGWDGCTGRGAPRLSRYASFLSTL